MIMHGSRGDSKLFAASKGSALWNIGWYLPAVEGGDAATGMQLVFP